MCALVKKYPVIEVIGSLPDPIKKTLSLFESVCISLASLSFPSQFMFVYMHRGYRSRSQHMI